MSFDLLFAAEKTIILHALFAMAAIVLGAVQLAGPKGTTDHRTLGWTWVMLMATVTISSFNIQSLKQFGNFSVIHLLSILTLLLLIRAVFYARKHNIVDHKHAMIALFFFALIITGGFTLVPGRLMNAVVFGAP